ncbi:MAG: hypothetical protein IE933_06430 [Sphingomonadales bacterium]|nr:hypothetical protein [Sphingomonadales bacterium]MBD3773536.1 hypothetical protein [Paracoccaceae bacterium]
MRLTRRHALTAGAALGAATALPLAGARLAARPALLVHDSRLAESPAFLAAHPATRRFDIAGEAAQQWRGLRGDGLARMARGPVSGLTRWSDWVQLRGALEAQGLRLASERILRPTAGFRHDLVLWAMRPRQG